MQKRALLGLVIGGVVLSAAACGQSGSTAASGAGAGDSSVGPSTAAGTGGSTTASGTGGSMATTGTGGSTTATTTSTSTTSSTSSTGGGGTGGSSGMTDHLLISEVATAPGAAECIEIYNPTAAAVDLTQYYLSDNAVYFGIAAGTPWSPPTQNPGTDFLVQFPAGSMIAAGATMVIAANKTFETTFNRCPDFILDDVAYQCKNGTAPAMLVPKNGGLDATKQGTLLSDAREMVILFQWDGAASTVKDVDYVTWGAMFDAGATRVDKTGMGTYKDDTAAMSQKPAAVAAAGQSIERCVLEAGEKMSGGNGLTGHDETSEPLDANFTLQNKPTPGVKNACLP